MLLFIGIHSPGAGLSFRGAFRFLHSASSWFLCPLLLFVDGPSLRTFQFGHECSKLEIESRRFELTARTSRPPRLGLHHQTICQTLRSTTEDMGRRVSCARAGRLGAMAYGLCSCIESSQDLLVDARRVDDDHYGLDGGAHHDAQRGASVGKRTIGMRIDKVGRSRGQGSSDFGRCGLIDEHPFDSRLGGVFGG